MATSGLTHVFWPFLWGFLVGFVADRAWRLAHVYWMDWRQPLPNERHRSRWGAVAMDPRWFAGAIAITVAAWSIFQTQANADEAARITADAKQFAAETRDCQTVLIQAIIDRAKVTAEYNAESDKQRDALADWLRTLLQPPPEIAALPGNDPVRQQWAIGVTTGYFNLIQASQKEQAATDARRPQLPEPNCSR